jgi:uncharacterized membrane protein HdeD (DUF308 family)
MIFGVKPWQLIAAACVGLMLGGMGYGAKNMVIMTLTLSLGITCIIGGIVGSWSWLTEVDKNGRGFKRFSNS